MSIQPADYQPQAAQPGWQPRQVLLFSGHMIDAPDRQSPRFPADSQSQAATAIQQALDKLEAGPQDLALTQGACGGDILFAEACLQRDVQLQLLQPFTEAEFIANSVIHGGADWLDRYHAITASLAEKPLAAPAELGDLPPTMNAYERCNLWLLATALDYGVDKLSFICLWDGGGGDGPGGTAHMVAEVKKQHGRVVWLNTQELFKADNNNKTQ